MDRDLLSNIQYYYTPPELIQKNSLIISGEEVKHIGRVMRHEMGEILHVTDGLGNDYSAKIERIDKKLVHCSIVNKVSSRKEFSNIVVCIPRLKSADRFELALEKCVELGITRFVVFDAERSVAKGDKSERWNKILLSAMKQSQHTYLPEVNHFSNISLLNSKTGNKLVFEQKGEFKLLDLLLNESGIFGQASDIYIVFGPEGGLSDNEIESVKDRLVVNMNSNRLRSETAVISAVSIITQILSSK